MNENSLLQQRTKELLMKSAQKLFTKLITYYKAGKLTREEFIIKLDRFKEKVKELEEKIKEIDQIIEERNNIDEFNFIILEHLSYRGYEKTAEYFRNKYFKEKKSDLKIYSDSEFYEKIREFFYQIDHGDCDKALNFIKEYKVLMKDSFDELEHKMKIISFIKLAQKDKSLALESARENFRDDSQELRNFLLNLLDTSDDELLKQHNEMIISEVRDIFYDKVKRLFLIEDRLMNLVNYGLIAYSTINCESELECPGCAYKKFSVMINRTENSIILCEGDKSILDESNMAYTDKSGKVYGMNYLQKSKKQLTMPRICYFV